MILYCCKQPSLYDVPPHLKAKVFRAVLNGHTLWQGEKLSQRGARMVLRTVFNPVLIQSQIWNNLRDKRSVCISKFCSCEDIFFQNTHKHTHRYTHSWIVLLPYISNREAEPFMITLNWVLREIWARMDGEYVIFGQPLLLLQQMVLLTEITSLCDPDFWSHVGSTVVATVTGASWWVCGNLEVAADRYSIIISV